MPVDPKTPVLIGYGQVNQRDETAYLEPIDLMAAAARQAADPRVLEAVDTIRVVNLLSAHYRDPGLLLGERIGADNPATGYRGVGGNVPQSLVNQACLDIRHGRAGVVLLAGAEAWRTRTQLRAQGSKLVWTRQDESVPMAQVADDDVPMAGPAELRIRLDRPAYVYPMFEQALRITAGESVDDHRRRIGELWARFNAVAVHNPHAWIRKPVSADEIDPAAQPGEPRDQLALHQADELQQHGRPGRRAHPDVGRESGPPSDPQRALGLPVCGHRRARHLRTTPAGAV